MLYLIFTKLFYMGINGARVLVYGSNLCCELSISGFLPSAVAYWKLLRCCYNHNTHIFLFFALSGAEVWTILINHPKPNLFSNVVKSESLDEIRIWEISEDQFQGFVHETFYIVTTSTSNFKQFFIFYNFYSIKQTFWPATIVHLVKTFNYLGQTQLHSTISVYISPKTNA